VNVDAVLAELPEAQRAIAEKVLLGGVPAVRAAVEEQNKKAVAEGREKVPADGLVQIAEQLLPRLRVAEWRDRALSAETIIEEIDLRDLRSIVVSADQLVAIDEATRGLVAKMKQALVVRQETEIRNWLEDIATATKVGRVVRALRLSSQPPKAGVPFPPGLATELVDATVAGMTVDAPSERWITLLEAAAFSPVHGKVLPPAVPTVISEDLLKTVTRLGPLMPQLAALFGVMVDPKARPPRPLQQPRGDKNPKKRAADVNKTADAKPPRGPKPSPAPKTAADAPVAAPVEGKPAVETPAVESPVVETPVVVTVAAEAPVVAAVVEETPGTDSAE
jgi:cell division protein FtsL